MVWIGSMQASHNFIQRIDHLQILISTGILEPLPWEYQRRAKPANSDHILNEVFRPLEESHAGFYTCVLKTLPSLFFWLDNISPDKPRLFPSSWASEKQGYHLKSCFPNTNPWFTGIFLLGSISCCWPRLNYSSCGFPNVLAVSTFSVVFNSHNFVRMG